MSKPPLKRNEAFTYGDDQERPPLPSGPRPEIWAKHVINPYVSIKGKVVEKEKKNDEWVLEDVKGGRRRRKTRKQRRNPRKTRKQRRHKSRKN